MTKTLSIKTKFGWITVFENKSKIFRINFGKVKKQKKSKILVRFKKNLLKFLNRKASFIRSPYTITGNQIQKKVWADLKRIKPGYVKTYGEIAKKHRLSPRHVGKICGQNKLLLAIPCHRVIRTDGKLGGFSSVGGTKLKKILLDFEKSWI